MVLLIYVKYCVFEHIGKTVFDSVYFGFEV